MSAQRWWITKSRERESSKAVSVRRFRVFVLSCFRANFPPRMTVGLKALVLTQRRTARPMGANQRKTRTEGRGGARRGSGNRQCAPGNKPCANGKQSVDKWETKRKQTVRRIGNIANQSELRTPSPEPKDQRLSVFPVPLLARGEGGGNAQQR